MKNSSIKLSNEEKNSLKIDLTKAELTVALKQTKRGKSPGYDGILVDFYMFFWNKLGDRMYLAFQDSIKKGRLFSSARTGIISLIPKRNHDPLEVAHWRPICLLQNDYKLLSKVMANRIKSMLPKLIHEDQAGFVPGRNLANNVRKAIDLITYSEVKNIEAMLVSIDFMKAFDLVDYNAMWKILEYFNFGDNIINWIKLLFKDFKLATVNAGNYYLK